MKALIFTVVLLTSFGYFFYQIKKLYSYLKIGESEDRFNRPLERLKNTIKVGLAQTKIFQEFLPGLMHALIFWGFCVLLAVVFESLVQGYKSDFTLSFLGPIYWLLTLGQDVFGVLVLIAVIVALYRRFILKVKRLTSERDHKFEAGLILVMIMIVITSMFGQNLFTIHNEENGRYLSNYLIASFGITPSETLYDVFWWIHILTILTFLNLLPKSKHFHVITSLPNVYFAKLDDVKNTLKPMNLEDENISHYGALDVEHLSWKQLLDGYTCTECGRCTSKCPANLTGKKLSPRKIIMDIRSRLVEKAPLILEKKESELLQKKLVGSYITEEELWACTSCMACMYECPVSIEHLDSIVEMRRGLVLTESSFPTELTPLFKNLENNFTPWAFSPEDRLNWAEGLDINVCASNNNPEYLFWVGCAGAFDARYQKVTRAFAQILKKAGIDFKVLGNEEKCNGDAARRLGNEYLAQLLIKENISTFENYGIKKIITTCPHCYHSLKNEYKLFGGNYDVIHHSEFILKLLKNNSIKLNKKLDLNATFHDSCYLGRYNGIFEQPREVFNLVNSKNLLEMERVKNNGFCCGAGGGRMWMEETEGKRVNIERTEEALRTKANAICSACPFCMTMFEDGLKSLGENERVFVKDIAEIVFEAI